MMRSRAFAIPLVFAVAVLKWAVPTHAHPHIFVETGVELVHDTTGNVTALRLTWVYDELFSLLLLEDMGLDDDFDGILTEAETEALQGFDMDWPDWYEGDVYVTAGGRPVDLSPPIPGDAMLLDSGMLKGSHTRPLATPLSGTTEDIVVKVYDPTFYTAYTIRVDWVSSQYEGCTTAVYTPDLDAAYARLEAALQELMGQTPEFDVELEFPPVGDQFAEEVRLTCTDGS